LCIVEEAVKAIEGRTCIRSRTSTDAAADVAIAVLRVVVARSRAQQQKLTSQTFVSSRPTVWRLMGETSRNQRAARVPRRMTVKKRRSQATSPPSPATPRFRCSRCSRHLASLLARRAGALLMGSLSMHNTCCRTLCSFARMGEHNLPARAGSQTSVGRHSSTLAPRSPVRPPRRRSPWRHQRRLQGTDTLNGRNWTSTGLRRAAGEMEHDTWVQGLEAQRTKVVNSNARRSTHMVSSSSGSLCARAWRRACFQFA
jgi:hypothetical protein